MALASDGNTLYVGNTGGESISIVDLDLGRVVDSVIFPPLPRNGTVNPVYPRSLAMGLFGLQFLMSNGTQWKVVGNTAIPRPADAITPASLAGCPACGMIASPGGEFIVTLNGSGQAYVYDGSQDLYVATRLLFPPSPPIQGYYGALGAAAGGSLLFANGLVTDRNLLVKSGAASPATAGQRNVAAVAPLGTAGFVRLTTPVRANITSTTRDDARTTLEMVDTVTGTETLVGAVAENPVVSVFGTTRFNTAPRQMVVNAAGTTAYAITLSGLSVIPLTAASNDTRPVIDSAQGVVNAIDPAAPIKPGSFITVSGRNLAGAATAESIPPPTVLGGSCVTFGNVAVPLLVTSGGQMQAQVPENLGTGTQIVEVRSLATGQASDPVTVVVQPTGATAGGPPVRDRTAAPQRR
jgi:hypothetical protein